MVWIQIICYDGSCITVYYVAYCSPMDSGSLICLSFRESCCNQEIWGDYFLSYDNTSFSYIPAYIFSWYVYWWLAIVALNVCFHSCKALFVTYRDNSLVSCFIFCFFGEKQARWARALGLEFSNIQKNGKIPKILALLLVNIICYDVCDYN